MVNLLKEIDRQVRERGEDELYLVSIGQKAQKIADRFEQRQDTTQETLDWHSGLTLCSGAGFSAHRMTPLPSRATT